MAVAQIQAISGVSAGVENVITVEYPSIGGKGIGKFLGSIYGTICNIASKDSGNPGGRGTAAVGFHLLKLAVECVLHLLITLPTAPLAILGIAVQRLFGNKYVLTNQNVQIWKAIGADLETSVALADIEDVQTQQSAGQEFYRCGDVILLGRGDKILMQLDGVHDPLIFRQNILEAQRARVQVDATLKTLNAR